MKQRGGRVLLWAVGFYAIAQIALVCTMENFLPVAFRSLLRAKQERLAEIVANNPDRPLLLALGSSRTEHGLEAERLTDLTASNGQPYIAYNYGLPALGALYSSLSLRETLDAGIHPQLLLVEYLPPLLNDPKKGCVSEEAWTAASWLSLPQLVRMWPYFKHPGQKGRDWLEARVAPWYVFRQEIQAVAHGIMRPTRAIRITVPYNEWGQMREECTWEERRRRTDHIYGLFHDSLGTLHVGKGPSKSLHDILDICKREHIQVVFVSMPEATIFHSWYSKDAMSEINDLLADLHDKHGAGVIDASQWIEDKEFLDGHHMTPAGGRIFSARLHDELRRILAEKELKESPRVASVGGQ
jgi:hypothetical protein